MRSQDVDMMCLLFSHLRSTQSATCFPLPEPPKQEEREGEDSHILKRHPVIHIRPPIVRAPRPLIKPIHVLPPTHTIIILNILHRKRFHNFSITVLLAARRLEVPPRAAKGLPLVELVVRLVASDGTGVYKGGAEEHREDQPDGELTGN